MSDTDKLVQEIELMTGSSWTPFQRSQVADKIREYRFGQIAEAARKAEKIVRESGGGTDLSSKIYT